MKLYVGNIPHATTEAELSDAFGAYGTVRTASVVTDRLTGESRGFGSVELEATGEAQSAIDALHGHDFGGRTLTVSEAKPRETRPRNGQGYDGPR